MQQYLDILNLILKDGSLETNRTGVSAYTYPHVMLRHDMSEGFPLLTTKKMAWKSIKVELEFFIKGLTDKKWLQERGCHIWDAWSDPQAIPHGLSDEERKKFQLEYRWLGKIYRWRDFNSSGIDQLKNVVDGLKKDPTDRRLLVSAWNPCEFKEQALPPCHVLFHTTFSGGRLHLCWFQRSGDKFLGIPFNLASYGLLLHLLCKETGYAPGILTGFLSNVHVYENHIEAAKIQLEREPFPLPSVKTDKFTSIFDWTYKDTILENYQSHPTIKAEIAV